MKYIKHLYHYHKNYHCIRIWALMYYYSKEKYRQLQWSPMDFFILQDKVQTFESSIWYSLTSVSCWNAQILTPYPSYVLSLKFTFSWSPISSDFLPLHYKRPHSSQRPLSFSSTFMNPISPLEPIYENPLWSHIQTIQLQNTHQNKIVAAK